MNNEITSSDAYVAQTAPSFLEGYIPEPEYARQRGVSLRTAQRDRQLRKSPPYIAMGRQIYYRLESVRAWLLAREREVDVSPPVGRRRRQNHA